MIYAYIRNLPTDPSGELQRSSMENKVIEEWVHEQSYRDNLELVKMIEKLEMGDRVYVYSFLTFAHSLSHLLSLVEMFRQKGVHLKFIKEQISLDSPVIMTLDELIRTFSEFHSETISLSTKSGMDEAKEKGVTYGRPRKKDANIQRAIEMYQSGNFTLSEIKEKTNISKTTLYRYLDKDYLHTSEEG